MARRFRASQRLLLRCVCFWLGMSFDRVGLAFGHDGRVTVNTDTLDLSDARRTIRPEHESEQPGHEIVELLAVVWIGMVGAFGAGLDVFLDAARAHGAPSRF